MKRWKLAGLIVALLAMIGVSNWYCYEWGAKDKAEIAYSTGFMRGWSSAEFAIWEKCETTHKFYFIGVMIEYSCTPLNKS